MPSTCQAGRLKPRAIRQRSEESVILHEKKHGQFLTLSPVQSFEELALARCPLTRRDQHDLVPAICLYSPCHSDGVQNCVPVTALRATKRNLREDQCSGMLRPFEFGSPSLLSIPRKISFVGTPSPTANAFER